MFIKMCIYLAGDVGCALAAVHQVLRSLVLQTLVDYASVVRATTQVNGEMGNSTPCHAQTH